MKEAFWSFGSSAAFHYSPWGTRAANRRGGGRRLWQLENSPIIGTLINEKEKEMESGAAVEAEIEGAKGKEGQKRNAAMSMDGGKRTSIFYFNLVNL